MRRLPPLSSLRTFEAAGRHLNLGQAASELCVTHGAISKQVKSLERLLGVTLTKRTRSGFVLTPDGQKLAPLLTKAFDGLASAMRSMGSEDLNGSIRVSCMPAFATNWLIPNLSRFRARHPEINLTIVPANRNDPLPDPRIDVAIIFGRPQWPNRKVELLKQLELFPVCSPQLLNGPKALGRPSDLLHHVLIDDPEGTHWREWFALTGVQEPADMRRLRFEDFNHCIAAAHAGLGVAMGDNVTTAAALARGTLVRPLKESLRPKAKAYYLVTPQNDYSAGSVLAFIDWLKQELQGADARAPS